MLFLYCYFVVVSFSLFLFCSLTAVLNFLFCFGYLEKLDQHDVPNVHVFGMNIKSKCYYYFVLFQFCQTYDVEFLPWRCWIGFWVMIILFCVVACEGCFLVNYFTRFTEEIFACLISAIFIFEAFHFLEKVRK